MIVGTVLEWFGAAVSWLGSLFSLPAPPAFLADLSGYASTVGTYVAGTGSWIPWPLLAVVIGVWAACLTAALVLKLVRIVASFASFGGGSAA